MQSNKTRLIHLIFLNFFTLLFLFSACKNQPKMESAESKQLPADFIQFYEKFHADSIYQMAHIQFPLEGYPEYADSSQLDEGKFYWQKETWVLHKLENFSEPLYYRQTEEPIKGIIAEAIISKKEQIGIYRRFYKRDNEWFLIFYSGMNSMKKGE
jgi:hypothetical protein